MTYITYGSALPAALLQRADSASLKGYRLQDFQDVRGRYTLAATGRDREEFGRDQLTPSNSRACATSRP